MRAPSRRRFLARAAAAGGWLAAATDPWLARVAARSVCEPLPNGELVRVLPLYGVGAREAPLGQMVGGSGLDARLFTDLSTLSPETLVTPTDQVYVRTAAPARLATDPEAWTIATGSGTGGIARLSAAVLAREAAPLGTHVMECAGNSNPQNFGLMSAVAWDGVLLDRVVARLPRPADATAVLVGGIDDEQSTSERSVPGASWVFPPAALARTGAFLAVRMNGAPLTADHGAPIRLVVPGWYGCAWIKWIDEIRWVGADEPATSQMLEFAGRTHQERRVALARDYEDPAIDTAAMPVRVEQWRVGGRIEYRVVGVVWGGERPVDRLVIRFGSRDAGTPFAVCPAPRSHHTWSLWTYRWQPAEPGYYDISLRVADPAVRTRRLDLSFYIRRVSIDEV